MRRFIPVFCASVLLSACGGGGEATEVASAISAVISGTTTNLIAGDTLSLSASKSVTSSAAASYRWTLSEKPAGSAVLLESANTADLQFIADRAGDYKVNLTVSDAGQTKTTSLVIQVAVNQQPELSLLSPELQNVLIDQSMRFDAAASRDPEGRALQFQWQVLSEPTGSQLVLADQSVLNVTPAVSGQYNFRLVVSDGMNRVSKDIGFTAYKSALSFKADATSAKTAEQQVTAFFGEGSLDMPLSHPAAEHLQIETDDVVGPHFVFKLHLLDDGDRELGFNDTDRQRAEIKSYSQSADALVCREGDRMEVDFSLKSDDINLSTSFTHLFQLKGKADTPLFTLSAQKTDGETALRLNHVQGTSRLSPLAAVPWDKVKDSWLAISLGFSCGSQGYLNIVIKDQHPGGVTYLDQKFPELKMWQDQSNDVYGIKTGLYRKIKENCLPAQADATASCADLSLIKKGLERPEDKVRLGQINIRKL
ncbi:hypothetical protein EMM73_15205 [Rheinheimera sediminis]|uniref:PKD domain-containing protein n=1 Tax=Rheinheimera sp. YQF-1 TaxID=2499626 RepID=UPI000FDAEF9B|nr:PKD domain-containing protein [Rheinheimera sp. YQF-1]RVT44837.1 hypothetical protein EMM73_15205 [Rheinheimera sp. YQF-1]